MLLKFLIFVTVCISVVSCMTTTTLQLETMRPGTIVLSNNIQNVAVIGLTPALIFTERDEREYVKSVRINPELIAKSELLRMLQFQNRLKIINADTLDLKNKLLTKYDSIPTAGIVEICNLLKVDALLVLNKTKYKDTIEINQENIDGYGMQYKMTIVYRLEMKWNLLDKTGQVIDIHYTTDSDRFNSYYGSYGAANANAPAKKDLIDLAANKSASLFAERILPYWQQKERLLYTGTLDFTKAETYLKTNQIDKAALIYRGYLKHESFKFAAIHNLAIAAEMKGSIDAAIDWATEYCKLVNSESELLYIKELEIRLKEADLIKKQLLVN